MCVEGGWGKWIRVHAHTNRVGWGVRIHGNEVGNEVGSGLVNERHAIRYIRPAITRERRVHLHPSTRVSAGIMVPIPFEMNHTGKGLWAM